MLILGEGTSAPEMVVSALGTQSRLGTRQCLWLSIINITLVLGLTAIIGLIVIRSSVVKQDMILLLP